MLEHRRRTWRENKLYKANMKKDRGSFVKDGGQSFPKGQSGGIPGPGTTRVPPRGQGAAQENQPLPSVQQEGPLG